MARESRKKDRLFCWIHAEGPAPPSLALSLKWEARGVSSASKSSWLGSVQAPPPASWWEVSAYWTRNLWCSCPEWGSRAGTGALKGLKPQQEGRHHSLFVLAQLSLPPQRSCGAGWRSSALSPELAGLGIVTTGSKQASGQTHAGTLLKSYLLQTAMVRFCLVFGQVSL